MVLYKFVFVKACCVRKFGNISTVEENNFFFSVENVVEELFHAFLLHGVGLSEVA